MEKPKLKRCEAANPGKTSEAPAKNRVPHKHFPCYAMRAAVIFFRSKQVFSEDISTKFHHNLATASVWPGNRLSDDASRWRKRAAPALLWKLAAVAWLLRSCVPRA